MKSEIIFSGKQTCLQRLRIYLKLEKNTTRAPWGHLTEPSLWGFGISLALFCVNVEERRKQEKEYDRKWVVAS